MLKRFFLDLFIMISFILTLTVSHALKTIHIYIYHFLPFLMRVKYYLSFSYLLRCSVLLYICFTT